MILKQLFSTAARATKDALIKTSNAIKPHVNGPDSVKPANFKPCPLVQALEPRPQGPYRRVTRKEVEETEKQVRWWNENSGY